MTRRRVRVATYNVHKCRGLDARVRPQRIAAVLREVDADVVALQEVLSVEGRGPEDDQVRFLAEELSLHVELGSNRQLRGGSYGNAVLSRLPLVAAQNHDLSVHGRERRGCLRVDAELGGGRLLHMFNVHLGTAYAERRRQGRVLCALLDAARLSGPCLVLGDFNEWAPGLASRLLTARLNSVDVRTHLRRRRTYPGVLPVVHLDHIYFDDTLELERLALHRTRAALLASDHLPLVAEFLIATPEPRLAAS